MMAAKLLTILSIIVLVAMAVAFVGRSFAGSRRSGLLRYVSHMQTHSGFAITVLTPSNDLALFQGSFSTWTRCPSGDVVTPGHVAQLSEFHARLLWAAPSLNGTGPIDPAALRSSTLKGGAPAVVKGDS